MSAIAAGAANIIAAPASRRPVHCFMLSSLCFLYALRYSVQNQLLLQ
jgi:hypothetical protein